MCAAKRTDETFHTRIDVGAIEGGDPRLHEKPHVLDRLLRIDGAMITREMPSPLDEARERIAVRTLMTRDHCAVDGRGVAVVSARRKCRLPVRVMRKRLG